MSLNLIEKFFIFTYFLVLFYKVKPSGFEYFNYESLTKNLKHFAESHPTRTHLYSIGKSVENRDIWVMALASHDPDKHIKLRPELKYVGNMHGNQVPTREVLYHLIHYLLENPDNDSNVDYILNNMRVHILVSLNPDGAEISIEGSCTGKVGRNNSNHYDLNRNFPDMFFCNDAPIQPETQAIIDWLEKNTFVLSAHLHTGAVVVSYGYENYPNSDPTIPKSNPNDDEDIIIHVSQSYSFSNPDMLHSNCNNETFEDGITNGAAWSYPVRGGMQDFNYWKYGCMEITVEIYCCYYPHADELSNIWKQNKDSLIEFLRHGNIGVKGIITYENGHAAKYISVKFDSREPSFKTNDEGEYYRILLPGKYHMALMLDCHEIYSTMIDIPEDTSLLVLNITLKNEIYEQSLKHSLNKYPAFCNESKAPVSCSEHKHEEETKETNESNLFKINFNLLFLAALIIYLIF